jgi:hypothetical protein
MSVERTVTFEEANEILRRLMEENRYLEGLTVIPESLAPIVEAMIEDRRAAFDAMAKRLAKASLPIPEEAAKYAPEKEDPVEPPIEGKPPEEIKPVRG